MTAPRWQQIYEDWKARQNAPSGSSLGVELILNGNAIAEGMRQGAFAPRGIQKTGESLKERHPKGSAGDLLADVCQWCLRPFTYVVKRSGKARDSVEYEPLRKILKIADANYEPVICDGCYEQVVHSAMTDKAVETPGWSNSGMPNLLLTQE